MGIERNGEAFYRAVMQKTQVPEARDLFEHLAQQEVAHYAIFEKMARELGSTSLLTAEEWDQYQSYLQATVQSALFESPERALAAADQAQDEKEAIHMAMGFEKETLLFFYNLRDLVPDRQQKTIQRIIDEEKKHVRRLAAML